MSNLTVRSAVALVGIPLILLSAMAGGLWFFLLVALISAGGLIEFYSLARKRGISPNVGLGLISGFFINLTFLHGQGQFMVATFFASLGLSVPLPTIWQSFFIVLLVSSLTVLLAEVFRRSPSPFLNVGSTILGLIYISLSTGCLIGLREIFIPVEFPVSQYFGPHGLAVPDEIVSMIDRWGGLTVASIFAGIWACDSAAYFAGRAFGRHKMAPTISPNKTWEGAVAGFVASVIILLVAREVVLTYLSFLQALLTGSVIGLFGQWGDLIESMFKREAGVKDSSALIPGHGGIIDRFDSLILVSPVLFLYYDFIVFAR